MSRTPIKFVFIGNLSKRVIMCQESVTNYPSTEKDSKQIFDRMCMVNMPKFNEHSKVPNKNGNYYFTSLIPSMFYLVLAEASYNETYVFELINEIHSSSIVDSVDDNGLIKLEGRQYLKVLIDKYQKKASYISSINNDINDIKIEMKGNIRNLVVNQDSLEGLNKQSNEIKEGSNVFNKNATDLKRITCWQNWKLWIIIILILIAVAIAIFVPIIVSASKGKSIVSGGDEGSNSTTVTNNGNSNGTTNNQGNTRFLV